MNRYIESGKPLRGGSGKTSKIRRNLNLREGKHWRFLARIMIKYPSKCMKDIYNNIIGVIWSKQDIESINSGVNKCRKTVTLCNALK